MNSGAHIMPVASPPSLTERLFWPAAGLAVVALGGFVYLFYLMFGSHAAPREADRPAEALTQPAVAPDAKPSAAPQELTAAAPQASAAAATPEQSAAAPAATAATDEPSEKAATSNSEKSDPSAVAASVKSEPVETAMAKPAEKPDVDPYAVPTNKPYLTRDMFQPPAAAKPQTPANAAKPKTPAAPGTVAAAKTPDKPKAAAAPPSAPAASAPHPDDKLTAPSASLIHGKIYVLKDGRRISTVSTVDLGDSYGVKDLNSSFITILKSNVSEVIGR